MKKIIFILSLFLLSHNIYAVNCIWTGTIDNDWTNASNWDCGVVPSASDDVVINNGTPTLNVNITVASLSMSQNAAINGTGQVSITNAFNLASGGDYDFEVGINVNGTGLIESCSIDTYLQSIHVNGSLTIDNSRIFLNNDAGDFIVNTGATLTVHDAVDFLGFASGGQLYVYGNLVKTGAGILDFETVYYFENANIQLLEGSIDNYFSSNILNCVINNSTLELGADAQLRIYRIIDIENTSISGGSIYMGFGIANFLTGNTLNNTGLTVSSGNLNFSEPLIITELVQTGGSFKAEGSTVLGDYDFQGGVLSGGLIVNGLTMISDNNAVSETRLSGRLTVRGGGWCDVNDFLSLIRIPENAVFEARTNLPTTINSVELFGTLRKVGTEDLSINVMISYNGSKFEGEKTIDGSISNVQATVDPGFAIDTMTITQSFRLLSTAIIKIELEENAGVPNHDVIDVGNDLYLDGKLVVTELGDLPPDNYTIMSAGGSRVGFFDSVILPVGYRVIYYSQSVVITNNCFTSRIISEPFGTGDIVHNQVSDKIIGRNYIQSGANITYDAGQCVELEAGFTVETGAEFLATIGGCN